jgi:hypothetical protein
VDRTFWIRYFGENKGFSGYDEGIFLIRYLGEGGGFPGYDILELTKDFPNTIPWSG